MSTAGHCLCRATAWRFEGPITWACYCHCDDCRRNCAAPVVGWLGVPDRHFSWTGQQPAMYESSKGVRRYFCSECGSPMAFEADHYPGGMHLYAASLDNPENFAPTFHVNYNSKLPWLQIEDDLEKHSGTLLESDYDLSDYQ